MNTKTFEKLIKQQRMRGEGTITGCRLVLVDGLSQAEASRAAGVTEALLSRALAKLKANVCPCCKRPF